MSGRPQRSPWQRNPSGDRVRPRTDRVRDVVRNELWPTFPVAFGEYEMGAEQATTRAAPPGGDVESFSTTDGMHSELVALDSMLTREAWQLTADGHVRTAHGAAVPEHEFRTDQPHCRFCSLFLALLDLPIRDGAATRGNYNQAGNLTYPLPEGVRHNPLVLGRLLTGNRPPAESLIRVRNELDLILNPATDTWVLRIDHPDGTLSFVTEDLVVDGDGGRRVITWDDVANGPSINVHGLFDPTSPLQYLWRLAFRGIYEAQE